MTRPPDERYRLRVCDALDSGRATGGWWLRILTNGRGCGCREGWHNRWRHGGRRWTRRHGSRPPIPRPDHLQQRIQAFVYRRSIEGLWRLTDGARWVRVGHLVLPIRGCLDGARWVRVGHLVCPIRGHLEWPQLVVHHLLPRLQTVPDTCANVVAAKNGKIPIHLKFGWRLLGCHSGRGTQARLTVWRVRNTRHRSVQPPPFVRVPSYAAGRDG